MAEVVVIGGGVAGLSAALRLRGTGREVTVLDGANCGAGASALAQGQLVIPAGPDLRPLFDESVEQYRLLHEWGGRASDFDQGRIGHLVVTCDPETDLTATHPHAAEFVDREAVLHRVPHLTPRVASGAWYPDAWRIEPRLITALLALACRAAGVTVMEHHRVVGLDRHAGRWRALTTRAVIEAPTVVLAAGEASADLAARVGVRLLMHGIRGVVLRTAPVDLPLAHILSEAAPMPDAPWWTPTVTRDRPEVRHRVRFMVHATEKGQLILGSSWAPPRSTRPAPVQRVSARAVRFVPAMDGVPIATRYDGARPCTPDGLPYVGQIAEGLYTSSGHGGAGFIGAPGSARLLTELISGTAPFTDPAPFSPMRDLMRSDAGESP